MDWFLYDRELRREKVEDVKLLRKRNPLQWYIHDIVKFCYFIFIFLILSKCLYIFLKFWKAV